MAVALEPKVPFGTGPTLTTRPARPRLVAGERDTKVLAEMAKGKLRKKIPDLQRALRGHVGDHHALLIGMSLDHIDHLEATIARLDAQIDAVFAANANEADIPFERARDRLGTIQGVPRGPRRRSSPRLVSTCRGSPPPDTSRHRPG